MDAQDACARDEQRGIGGRSGAYGPPRGAPTRRASRLPAQGWARAVGWETLLNRAGTTFRKLPEAERGGIDAARALRLMLAQPSMIKRPVLVAGDRLIVGFKAETYAAAFG